MARSLFFVLVGLVFVFNVQAYDETKLIPSDGATFDFFGRSVDIDGDTAVVGAYSADNNDLKSGSAYVYTRNGSNWVETELISDAETDDRFGYSVAIDDNTLAVGAPGSNSLYVYTRDDSGWSLEQKLLKTGGIFGNSVDIDGDTMVVGAYQDLGAAYVYTRSGDIWTLRKMLTAPVRDPLPGLNDSPHFGGSVAIDDGTIVVGAYQYSYNAVTYTGAAWVFTGSGSNWQLQGDLAALAGTDLEKGDFFGWSVDVDGDTVLVGAYRDGGSASTGAAYTFIRNGSEWSKQQKFYGTSYGGGVSYFGCSVSLQGDRAFIGSYYDVIGGQTLGSVHEFKFYNHPWLDWFAVNSFRPSDVESLDLFGFSVAQSESFLIAGSHRDNNQNGSVAGAVYLYDLRTSFDLQFFARSWLTDDWKYDIVPGGGDGVVNWPDFAELAKQSQTFKANAGPDQTHYTSSFNPVFIALDGSYSTGDILSWEWYWHFDDGGGRLDGWDEISFTDFYPGVYNLTLTVTDRSGNTSSDDVVITIIEE